MGRESTYKFIVRWSQFSPGFGDLLAFPLKSPSFHFFICHKLYRPVTDPEER